MVFGGLSGGRGLSSFAFPIGGVLLLRFGFCLLAVASVLVGKRQALLGRLRSALFFTETTRVYHYNRSEDGTALLLFFKGRAQRGPRRSGADVLPSATSCPPAANLFFSLFRALSFRGAPLLAAAAVFAWTPTNPQERNAQSKLISPFCVLALRPLGAAASASSRQPDFTVTSSFADSCVSYT